MSGYYLVSSDDAGDERWDDDTSSGTFVEATWEHGATAPLPPFLDSMPEWAESYSAGYRIEDAVRWSLGQDGESLSDAEAAGLLAETLAGMSPEHAENFLKTLGRVAQAALPVVGGAVGSIIAPGIGTALGGALGQAAGGMLGRATQGGGRGGQRMAPSQQGRRMHQSAPSSRGRGGTAGSAINALMGMLNDPRLLGAVANAALGGRGSAPGSGASFGSLMNALRSLAGEAAAEMHEGYAAESSLHDSADNAETLVRIIGSVGGAASAGVGGRAL